MMFLSDLKLRLKLKKKLIFLSVFLFTGCYSFEQGYGQFSLLLKQQKIEDVLEENKETKDRIEKLKLVKPILAYAESEIGLTPGNSYKKYIALESTSVSWVVQGAEKRKLKLKTWWFPFVGSQPYLGFFEKDKAFKKRDELKNEGFDTVMGGVSAFSLLGYYPDPIYSSMLDQSTLSEFIEVLIHESVHRTLYIPDYYSFNENLADFIAKRATVHFLDLHPELKINSQEYFSQYKKNLLAQKKFQEYLGKVKKEITEFYEYAEKNSEFNDESIFLAEREIKFNQIASEYKKFMNGLEIGTNYEFSFQKGKINNAVILSYSIYEAKQEPLEKAYQNAKQDLKLMLNNLKNCLSGSLQDEKELWNKVENCRSVSESKP
nr:aminopeptidase [Pigmentibacter ruber]